MEKAYIYPQYNFYQQGEYLKRKVGERRRRKAHIQIGLSINPPCNFLFELKSCIIVINLSAFMKGGISNLKNETIFTIQNIIFASKEGISQFQFCDSKLREHTKLKGERKNKSSCKRVIVEPSKENLLLLLSLVKWVRR